MNNTTKGEKFRNLWLRRLPRKGLKKDLEEDRISVLLHGGEELEEWASCDGDKDTHEKEIS